MLAIVGGKGGCGKTTTAIGLARALAAAGDRPLVVDADCDMPNLHTAAETDRRPGIDAFADGAAIGSVVHRSRAYPRVEVLPAGAASGSLAPATLRRLSRQRGTVILDCPAGASDGVATPLRVADDAVVVSTADRTSLADAAKSVRMARTLDARCHGAVVTRCGRADPPAFRESPLADECRLLTTVPEVATDVLASRVGRGAYRDVADKLRERNI